MRRFWINFEYNGDNLEAYVLAYTLEEAKNTIIEDYPDCNIIGSYDVTYW